MSSRKSTGFTIVELLVVITIIGILMALLFPAINAAREGARKGNCISNQGQIGKAVLTYTTRKGDFPKHLNDKSGGSGPMAHAWPWVANIMTELGRGDIAEDMQPDTTNNSKHDPSTRTEYIEILVCPSDPPVSTTSQQINYVANGGFSDPMDDTGDDPTIADGVFQRTKDVSLSYVAMNDGTSTTLMVTENVDANNWNDNTPGPNNVVDSTVVWTQADPPTGCGLNEGVGTTGSCSAHQKARPSSNHSGGFVATFCDGHTEFLSDDIDYNIYRLIMTPNGSKATGGPQAILSEAALRK